MPADEGTEWGRADWLYLSETPQHRKGRRPCITASEGGTGTVVEVTGRRLDSSKKDFLEIQSHLKSG